MYVPMRSGWWGAGPSRGLADHPPALPRVAQAYVNQRKLDHEVKTLQIQAAQFAKQTGQWINMVENFNQALKVSPPRDTIGEADLLPSCAPPHPEGRGTTRKSPSPRDRNARQVPSATSPGLGKAPQRVSRGAQSCQLAGGGSDFPGALGQVNGVEQGGDGTMLGEAADWCQLLLTQAWGPPRALPLCLCPLHAGIGIPRGLLEPRPHPRPLPTLLDQSRLFRVYSPSGLQGRESAH